MRAERPLTVLFGNGPVIDKQSRVKASDAGTVPGNEDMTYVGYNLARAAVRLMESGEVHNLFVAGGQTGGTKYAAESELVIREMIRLGADPERIAHEKMSESTVENFVHFLNHYDGLTGALNTAPVNLLGLESHRDRLRLFSNIYGAPVNTIFSVESILGDLSVTSSGIGVEQGGTEHLRAMEEVWKRHILTFPGRLLKPSGELQNDDRVKKVVKNAFEVYETEELEELGLRQNYEPRQLREQMRLIEWPIHAPDEHRGIVERYLNEPWPDHIHKRYGVAMNLSSGRSAGLKP